MAAPSTPPALDDGRLASWASVATLLERLPAALDAQLQRDSGLTHFEHGVLFALDTAPDRSLRLSTLAGYASCTLSRLSRAITRMAAKGWVRRVVDPGDGRFTLAVLTDEGHAHVERSTPGHHALVTRLVFDSLSAAQVQQLTTISRQISHAIDPAPAWSPDADAASG